MYSAWVHVREGVHYVYVCLCPSGRPFTPDHVSPPPIPRLTCCRCRCVMSAGGGAAETGSAEFEDFKTFAAHTCCVFIILMRCQLGGCEQCSTHTHTHEHRTHDMTLSLFSACVSPSVGASVHQLSHDDRHGGTSCQGEDLHLQEAHQVPELDRCHHQR